MHEFRIVVGDWSNDGHGKYEEITLECSHSVEKVQQAYKESCSLTGVAFDHNQGFDEDLTLAVEYDSNIISFRAEEKLKEYGLDIRSDWPFMKDRPEEELYFDNVRHFIGILMRFIQLSIPDLNYKEKEKPPVLNGWWDKNLNVQFGYGLFE